MSARIMHSLEWNILWQRMYNCKAYLWCARVHALDQRKDGCMDINIAYSGYGKVIEECMYNYEKVMMLDAISIHQMVSFACERHCY